MSDEPHPIDSQIPKPKRLTMVEGIPIVIGPSNKAVERDLHPQEVLNSYTNHRFIWNEFADERAVSVASLRPPEGESRGPIMVLGSGASLDEAGPYLKDWKGAIICSASHASTCYYWGHPPEYIVGMDIRTPTDKLHVPDWGSTKTCLLSHVGMSPDFISWWIWKKAYYFLEYPAKEFYRETVKYAYPMIEGGIFMYAHSMAAEMSFAAMLGYSPIILVGGDFGCPGKWYRFHAMLWDKDKKEWHRERHQQDRQHMNRLMRSDTGTMTTPLDIFYKRALLNVWRTDKIPTLNASKASIITQFPKLSIKEVIKRQDRGYEDLYRPVQETVDDVDVYLSRHNCYPIVGQLSDGREDVEFIEVQEGYELELLRKRCQRWKDATEGPDHHVDVDANMARIQWTMDERKRRYPGDAKIREDLREAAKQGWTIHDERGELPVIGKGVQNGSVANT